MWYNLMWSLVAVRGDSWLTFFNFNLHDAISSNPCGSGDETELAPKQPHFIEAELAPKTVSFYRVKLQVLILYWGLRFRPRGESHSRRVTWVKGAKELIEQGLLSLEMQYFVKETFIYVLVVVFLEKPNCWIMPRTRALTSRILYRTQKGRHTCFTYEWTLKQTLPRGPTWRDAFACGIWTREVFIKAHGDFGSRKITL